MIKDLSNCWKILKLHIPQRNGEIHKRDGGESGKKYVDDIRLNPKCFYNGQSAAKLRTGECSTTIRNGVHRKRLAVEVVGVLYGRRYSLSFIEK